MTLRRETLADLTPADLESVVAGRPTIGCTITLFLCLPTHDCTQVTT